ncbi:MAG: metalloprotease TldD [Alphaproteobacteria bacterium]
MAITPQSPLSQLSTSQDALSLSNQLFFEQEAFQLEDVQRLVNQNLHDMEDGELYLQYTSSEMLSLEDGRIKSANYDISKGFGLRAVESERVGYAHASELSKPALARAGETVRSIRQGHQGNQSLPPNLANHILYKQDDPVMARAFAEKVAILEAMDHYARSKDPRVVQLSASMAAEWTVVEILRPDGFRIADVRPLIRVNASIIVEQNGRREVGSHGTGGRGNVDFFLTEQSWKAQIDEALRQALVNLESVAAPAGEMTVVLGAGWPGILLHEAIGHGLEGDFNRKQTSAFSDMMGKQIAAKGVTVIDDGTIMDRRGSLNIDDEGTPTNRTILIEDGILVNYLHDRQNARLMNMNPTGNGRRQSFAHVPMPRMTNTFMNNGAHDHEEIIKSVKKGIYAPQFGGGQVDITNGKFVFSCTEAYLIEDGKITAPLKGATLIGNGPDALTKISMIGNDMQLDPGIGTCGKNGQGVPVGVGQPTLRMDGLTVGGTA